MNNTTLGTSDFSYLLIPNPLSIITYLPVNIYILVLIISRQWIVSEFYIFIETIMEICICFYDIIGLIACITSNSYLLTARDFCLGFLVTGRPCVLALICVERYLAIVKPVAYMKLKPLKYKLGLTGMVWFITLACCFSRLYMAQEIHRVSIVVFTSSCVTKLYCCIASLRVLRRPKPGDGSRQQEGMNGVKLKAFKVILVITLSVFFFYIPLAFGVLFRYFMEERTFVLFMHVGYQCTSFTGAIHALLFLQRCGKLAFITWL